VGGRREKKGEGKERRMKKKPTGRPSFPSLEFHQCYGTHGKGWEVILRKTRKTYPKLPGTRKLKKKRKRRRWGGEKKTATPCCGVSRKRGKEQPKRQCGP